MCLFDVMISLVLLWYFISCLVFTACNGLLNRYGKIRLLLRTSRQLWYCMLRFFPLVYSPDFDLYQHLLKWSWIGFAMLVKKESFFFFPPAITHCCLSPRAASLLLRNLPPLLVIPLLRSSCLGPRSVLSRYCVGPLLVSLARPFPLHTRGDAH